MHRLMKKVAFWDTLMYIHILQCTHNKEAEIRTRMQEIY